ncbi:unnamed protein product [Ambrosiozyma monospora]|uniref:Unnamed protein product n=1 Tax=Ambrosiozyma monospora TaxID=43982 RepID=A0ACB5U3N6_AMBMO|nr:unnamed protein product [Ambrosiozyma monospora]
MLLLLSLLSLSVLLSPILVDDDMEEPDETPPLSLMGFVDLNVSVLKIIENSNCKSEVCRVCFLGLRTLINLPFGATSKPYSKLSDLLFNRIWSILERVVFLSFKHSNPPMIIPGLLKLAKSLQIESRQAISARPNNFRRSKFSRFWNTLSICGLLNVVKMKLYKKSSCWFN